MSIGVNGYPLTIRELFFREATGSYHVPAHTQSGPQWYCVIHGCVEHRIDGQPFLLRALESLLIPAGTVREPQARAKSVG